MIVHHTALLLERMNYLIFTICMTYSDTSATITPSPLERLLPNNKQNLYRFEGSLTTPGCFETVTWTVLHDTVKISENQVKRQLMPHILHSQVNTHNEWRKLRTLPCMNSIIIWSIILLMHCLSKACRTMFYQ